MGADTTALVAKRSTRKELRTLLGMAFPIMLSMMLSYLMALVDLFMVGHLGTHELAAAALANTLFSTLQHPVFGSATALDTLLSQSFGAGMFALYGQWAQVGTLLLMCAMVPMCGLLALAGPILHALGQTPEIVASASRFCLLLIPGVPPLFLAQCLTKYLQSQDILAPAVYIGLAANILNVAGNWLLIHHLEFGFDGAPLATSLARWLQCAMLVAYIWSARASLAPTLPGVVIEWAELPGRAKTLVRLGIPGALSKLRQSPTIQPMCRSKGHIPTRSPRRARLDPASPQPPHTHMNADSIINSASFASQCSGWRLGALS